MMTFDDILDMSEKGRWHLGPLLIAVQILGTRNT